MPQIKNNRKIKFYLKWSVNCYKRLKNMRPSEMDHKNNIKKLNLLIATINYVKFFFCTSGTRKNNR